MSLTRSKLWMTLALVIAGCGQRVVPPTTSTNEQPASTIKKGAEPTNVTAEDILTSAVFQLRPENFGINSATDKPVSLLNSWRFKQIEQDPNLDQPVPVNAPSGWVQADDEARLAQAKFDKGDAIRIRDAFLFHALAGYLSDRGRDELQRAGIVVDFVCRNVGFWKDDEIELPLTPYLTMQVGRGSADDRAAVCAEIFKQLRIDTIILRTKTDVKESSDKWLFGVVIDRKVYPFDLRLGLPLTSGTGDKSTTPVALDEIVSHPEILGQMSVGEPYRLTVEDLREPAVFVISNPHTWCYRMYKLEQALPVSDACILYDPLIGKDDQTGLLSRIATGGGWPVESLKLWGHPRRQSEASLHPSEASAQEFQRLTVPFTVPIPFKKEADGKFALGVPENMLQRIRTEQLLGKFTDATKKYLSIRHLEVEPHPPNLEPLNRLAAEDAFYWTGLCKFEMNDYSAAIDQLSAYVKKYDRKGKWYFSARSLLAQCYAEKGQLPEAIKTLERTSSDDPYHAGNAVRVKRWAAARTQ